MATSGTNTFNLDLAELIEEAYEPIGEEVRSGYDMRTARRSLNLLFLEWANEGVHLWKLDQLSTSLTQGTSSYTLGAKYIDLIDVSIRQTTGTTNSDSLLSRVNMGDYLGYGNKAAKGKPGLYMVERNQLLGHTLYVYPTPDASYTLISWALSYVEDAGVYTNNADVPRRFLPALIKGLTWQLANKNPEKIIFDEQNRPVRKEGIDINRRAELENAYRASFTLAKDEDRERANLFLLPRVY